MEASGNCHPRGRPIGHSRRHPSCVCFFFLNSRVHPFVIRVSHACLLLSPSLPKMQPTSFVSMKCRASSTHLFRPEFRIGSSDVLAAPEPQESVKSQRISSSVRQQRARHKSICHYNQTCPIQKARCLGIPIMAFQSCAHGPFFHQRRTRTFNKDFVPRESDRMPMMDCRDAYRWSHFHFRIRSVGDVRPLFFARINRLIISLTAPLIGSEHLSHWRTARRLQIGISRFFFFLAQPHIQEIIACVFSNSLVDRELSSDPPFRCARA